MTVSHAYFCSTSDGRERPRNRIREVTGLNWGAHVTKEFEGQCLAICSEPSSDNEWAERPFVVLPPEGFRAYIFSDRFSQNDSSQPGMIRRRNQE